MNTKKCIATYINYFLNFKTALYSSAVVMKLLTIVESCFKSKLLITVKLKACLSLNALLCMHPITLITEVLCLVATFQVFLLLLIPRYLSLLGRHS